MSWQGSKAEWREPDLATRDMRRKAPDAGPLIATGSGWPIRRRGDATGEPRRTLLGDAERRLDSYRNRTIRGAWPAARWGKFLVRGCLSGRGGEAHGGPLAPDLAVLVQLAECELLALGHSGSRPGRADESGGRPPDQDPVPELADPCHAVQRRRGPAPRETHQHQPCRDRSRSPEPPGRREVASAPPFPIGIPPPMAESIQITLPDGSTKQAPSGQSARRLREGVHRPGLAKAALLARFNGDEVDLSRRSEQREAGDRHREEPRGARARSVTTPRTSWRASCSGSSPAPRSPSARRSRTASTTTSTASSRSPRRTSRRSRRRRTRRSRKDLPVRPRGGLDGRGASRSSRSMGEKFKVEIVEDIVAKGAKTLTLYRHGDWVDFCLGPHGPSTGKVGVDQAARRRRARTGAAITATPSSSASTAPRSSTRRTLDAWLQQQEEAQEARPPQARQGARPLRTSTRSRRAPRSGRRKGTALYHALADCDAPALPRATATQEIKTPLLYNKRALGDERPLGQVPREHVPRARQRAIAAEDERAASRSSR